MTNLGLGINYRERTSQQLRRFSQNLEKQNISYEYLLSSFQQQSFASLFFILAVLCFVPGVSIFAGFVLVFLSIQIIAGKKIPQLPQIIATKNISTRRFKKGVHWLLPYLMKLENSVKPRWRLLALPKVQRFNGIVFLILAIIVAIPFPLSNILPAIAMVFLSIGMLEQDGVFIACGLLISTIALAVGWIVIESVYFWFEHFFLL